MTPIATTIMYVIMFQDEIDDDDILLLLFFEFLLPIVSFRFVLVRGDFFFVWGGWFRGFVGLLYELLHTAQCAGDTILEDLRLFKWPL